MSIDADGIVTARTGQPICKDNIGYCVQAELIEPGLGCNLAAKIQVQALNC